MSFKIMRKQITLLVTNISLAVSAAVSESAGLPNGGVWKDVDGVLNADPKIFPDAVQIAELLVKGN